MSFNQLCLPRAKGGLGVLNPLKQALTLQYRHLRHVFNRSSTSTLVQPFLRHHLFGITASEHLPSLSFFIPELRYHTLNHPTSIVFSMYKAFDHFKFSPDLANLSLQNLLLLPLSYFFTAIPSQHWLLKRTRFSATNFFIFDSEQKRLRLKVAGEYTIKPGLCKRLYQQILKHRSIHL
ncbi:hypothetical protein BDF21DRAFT_336509, partial [Thamnidium elegans]